jgi:hypothetical protein
MARLAQAILSGPFTTGFSAPMVDVRYGGQNGYGPVLTEWVNNQAYVAKQMVCLLIEAPRGFAFLPDPDFWVGALKALVERQPKTISGMQRGLKVETVENAVSGGGEMQQDMIDVKRDRTVPSFTWIEKYGRIIQNFLEQWITNLLADPDSKIAMVATLPGVKPTDMLADIYSCTCLFFEPDPTHTKIMKAWLTTNMYPLGTGDITAKRELSSAMESGEITVEFSGLSQSGFGVSLFAQALLESINITNANPNLAPAFVGEIDADVLAANTGYAANAESLGAAAVVTRE